MDFTQLPAILTPDLGLLFWMLLAFLVVFFVLAKFGFPAIINMVDERNKYIDESLLKAREAQERLAKAHQESARIVSDAKAEIEQQKKAAIADIRKQVATLSVEIAEKVLKQNLQGDKAQMDLIDRMLDDVSSNQ